MTTFEDFFAKKKIDLSQLQGIDPALYDEFKLHYAQMGEKSFDHSKKFWFNKLRKQYHLAEVELPVEAAPKPQAASTAVDNSQTDTPAAAKPAGFKPRFKAGGVKAVAEVKATEAKVSSEAKEPDVPKAAIAKPAGFKPRFKAGATKAAPSAAAEVKVAPEAKVEARVEEEKAEASATEVPKAAPSSKPAGFKPRFKAGVTKTKPQDGTASS